MKNYKKLLISFTAFLAFSASAVYPDRPIKLIVPYAPGGSSDIVGRQVAQYLGKALGQTVIVENIGGAGGSIGVQRAVTAMPDGYTLLLGANSELLINKLLRPELPYNALTDLTALGSIGTGSIVIVGKPNLQAKDLSAALALATKNGGLNYGTSGLGTIQHLAGEMIRLKSGAPLTHIPYRGAGPLASDVAGGQVDLGIATLASVKQMIEGGQMKAYAVSADKPSEFSPTIPPLSDTPRLTNLTLETWYGVFAPANLPPSIAATLQQKLQTVVNSPELAKNLSDQAISISRIPSSELTDFLIKENDKFRAIISSAKINIQ